MSSRDHRLQVLATAETSARGRDAWEAAWMEWIHSSKHALGVDEIERQPVAGSDGETGHVVT